MFKSLYLFFFFFEQMLTSSASWGRFGNPQSIGVLFPVQWGARPEIKDWLCFEERWEWTFRLDFNLLSLYIPPDPWTNGTEEEHESKTVCELGSPLPFSRRHAWSLTETVCVAWGIFQALRNRDSLLFRPGEVLLSIWGAVTHGISLYISGIIFPLLYFFIAHLAFIR